jgi:hypothetical protein
MTNLQEGPSPDDLMEAAYRRTGLSDLGDPGRQAGLQAFVGSLQTEAWPRMTLQARALVVEYMTHLLATRLKLIADRKQYPEIARQEVPRC